jgi:hypothetical protein
MFTMHDVFIAVLFLVILVAPCVVALGFRDDTGEF